jgi:hypothetical protein
MAAAGHSKDAQLGFDNVKSAQRLKHGYKGSFVQTMQADVETLQDARACGAENAILLIQRYCFM